MKNTALVALCLLVFAHSALAYKPNSDDHVRFGVPSRGGIIVSGAGFISCYSEKTGMPQWVSYHMKRPDPSKKFTPRKTYSTDSRIKSGTTDPGLYAGINPYEPAKMAPAKHMPDKKTHAESYVTSNVCPMHEGLSRGAWLKLENIVYGLAQKKVDLWVISGPVFAEGNTKKTKTGIRVPDAFFKVIIYQGDDYAFRAAAFVMKNKPLDGDVFEHMVKVKDVEQITGLKFATALPEKVREELIAKKPEPALLKSLIN